MRFGDSALPQDQWHYERNGKRLGPVDRATIGSLIDDKHIERATLVWNPDMADWAQAGTTDLVELFGNAPPPLPAFAISRWAIFTLALFPLWGLLIQAVLSAYIGNEARLGFSQVFSHVAWIGFYVVGNIILAEFDARSLRGGGARLRGATVLSVIAVPIYILVSCLTFKRHFSRGTFAAFLPLLIWVASVFGSIIAVYPLFLDEDAPAMFRPDAQF